MWWCFLVASSFKVQDKEKIIWLVRQRKIYLRSCFRRPQSLFVYQVWETWLIYNSEIVRFSEGIWVTISHSSSRTKITGAWWWFGAEVSFHNLEDMQQVSAVLSKRMWYWHTGRRSEHTAKHGALNPVSTKEIVDSPVAWLATSVATEENKYCQTKTLIKFLIKVLIQIQKTDCSWNKIM